MPKEEVVSEPETNDPNGESGSSDENDEAEEGTEIVEPNTPEQAMETDHDVTEAQTMNQTEKEAAEPGEESADKNRGAEIETPDSDSDIEIIGEVKKGTGNPPPIIDIDDTATEQKSDKIKVEPKLEPEPQLGNPTPSTSSTPVPTITSIQEQLKQLSSLVYRHMEETMSIVEGPQKPRSNIKKEEPKEADPAPSKTLERAIWTNSSKVWKTT